MPKSKKTWREKLLEPAQPKIVDIPARMQKAWGQGTMAIARPLDIDRVLRRVPPGRLILVSQIMTALADHYGTNALCPMTTGIFLRIVAEAAEEDRAQGIRPPTPWWRSLKVKGKLNPKFPGGVEAQAHWLIAEGHTIVPGRGKQPPSVEGFQAALAQVDGLAG